MKTWEEIAEFFEPLPRLESNPSESDDDYDERLADAHREFFCGPDDESGDFVMSRLGWWYQYQDDEPQVFIDISNEEGAYGLPGLLDALRQSRVAFSIVYQPCDVDRTKDACSVRVYARDRSWSGGTIGSSFVEAFQEALSS